MPNALQYAAVFQSELDKAAREKLTSGWMEPNEKNIKYSSGAEVKIPTIDMDGLGDYDRQDGHPSGSVDLKWETKTMTMDRGRGFNLDANDVDETNFVANASAVLGEFQNKHVIPEIDAYRYSTIAAGAVENKVADGGYTPAENTILKKLYYDIAAVQEVVGQDVPLMITMPTLVAAMFSMSDGLAKKVDVVNFSKGDIALKVRAIDGIHPINPVSAGRLKSKYVFQDGRTAEQLKGGFAPADDAKNINWIICPANYPIAVSRTDTVRIFDPMTYQKVNAWHIDYRKYHDLWVTKNKWPGIKVNFKESL